MSIQTSSQFGVRHARSACAVLLLTLAASGHVNAATCRVTTTGTSAGTGTWASPMDLQTALTAANCTEVWVAAGVYKPGITRTATFDIHPGVAVYGGFAGTEITLGARDPTVNVTILSGDIDNNDINADGNNIAETSADIQGGNSDHIAYMDGTTGTKITASTVLDGFTISGGQANGGGSPQDRGGGLYCDGGGIGHECSPTLSNMTFSGNSAQSGGAMYNDGDAGTSSPTLSNVTFTGNSATTGGAMFNDGRGGGTSSPALSNITLSGNSANVGGAMFNVGSGTGISSPTLSNVTFNGNSANYGGAMYNWGYGGTSSPTLSNVTFSGNSAAVEGGAMHNNATDAGTSNPTLSNVILWGDMATSSAFEIMNYAASGGVASPAIDHSVVQGSGGSANWDTNLGTDGGGNLDADPLLGPLGNHGGSTATLLLGAGSVAIDAGNASTCGDPNSVNGLDQRGITRPQGAACDIGSVEMESIFADGFESTP